MSTEFEATRKAGLSRLEVFAPLAATADKKSGLSPYLSHRLLTPSEVASALIEQHKPQALESFLSQLCWGTYWRGWLEGRPGVYTHWRRLLAEDKRRWPEREEFQQAVSGETGIDCFDAWVQQLAETGYLSHMARLNFASIWLFTLKLPWSLGAAFFLEHLVDGQVASTLLNWRAVGGLQGQGKPFLASADKIRSFSQGRFHPDGQLSQAASSLPASPIPAFSPGISYPLQVSSQIGDDYGLLITDEDHLPEVGGLGPLKPRLVFVMTPEALKDEATFSAGVKEFKAKAAQDTKKRAEQHFDCPAVDFRPPSGDLEQWARSLKEQGVTSLAYHEPFVGPVKTVVSGLSARDVGLKFFPIRRTWDAVLHTHAAKGFVHFKKQALPLILRKKGKI